jgi:predicted AAA+ superfamily ATPase
MAITAPDAARAGQLLETLVTAELRKQSTWSDLPLDLFHFRQRNGSEVDIVLETPDRRIAGIEVKASSTIDPRDFRGLHQLADMAGPGFTLGVVLHTGRNALRFGPRMWALPVAALWT